MAEVCFISYSSGVLQRIVPFLEHQSHIHISDGKVKQGFSEIWLDAYIDLFDPKLYDPNYLYTFFLRLQEILNSINLKTTTVRLFQNFYHTTSHPEMRRVQLLYRSFTEYLCDAYGSFPVFIPDMLDKSYTHHPYFMAKENKSALIWEASSMIRVIHPNDIVSNILENPIEKAPYIITGMKITLLDLCEKIHQIFGTGTPIFEGAYSFEVDDKIKGVLLQNNYYNLESIFMSQLSQ